MKDKTRATSKKDSGRNLLPTRPVSLRCWRQSYHDFIKPLWRYLALKCDGNHRRFAATRLMSFGSPLSRLSLASTTYRTVGGILTPRRRVQLMVGEPITLRFS